MRPVSVDPLITPNRAGTRRHPGTAIEPVGNKVPDLLEVSASVWPVGVYVVIFNSNVEDGRNWRQVRVPQYDLPEVLSAVISVVGAVDRVFVRIYVRVKRPADVILTHVSCFQ